MNRDPEKARAWRERSARKAEANRRARALASRSAPRDEGGKTGSAPARGAPLRSRSRKPSRVAHQRSVAAACREAIERDGHRCQAPALVPEVSCWGRLDPQHVIPQGVRRDLADDPANIVACCRGHHEYVGDHPERARELGLHGFANDDLEELRRRRLRAGEPREGHVLDALPPLEADRER